MNARRILVCYDFTSRCREAWRYAQGLAERCGGTVEAAHVRSWFDPDGAPMRRALSPRARRRLAAMIARQIPGALRGGYHVAEGSPADVILGLIERRRIDLVVLASEGAAAARRLAPGSLAEALLGTSPVPVLTLFERWRAARSLLVPLQGERLTAAGLELVTQAARALNARLAVKVVPAGSLAEESLRHGMVAVLTGRARRAAAALDDTAAEIMRLSRAPVLAVPELSASV